MQNKDTGLKIFVYKELFDGNTGKIWISNSQKKNDNHYWYMLNLTDNEKGTY